METREYRTEDKSTWGAGPWMGEPDKVQYEDASGLPALIVRSSVTGALCGYIGVPEGHPWFGKGYDDLDVEVHGGLTFAGPCRPRGNEAEGICHVPAPGESDKVWWLGFDCAHAFDLTPAMNARLRKYSAELLDPIMPQIEKMDMYRDIDYVKEQNAELADQVRAAQGA